MSKQRSQLIVAVSLKKTYFETFCGILKAIIRDLFVSIYMMMGTSCELQGFTVIGPSRSIASFDLRNEYLKTS